MEKKPFLRSIDGQEEFPLESLAEYSSHGVPLECIIPGIGGKKIRQGKTVWERFAAFFPLEPLDMALSLGEGDTPYLKASPSMQRFTGLSRLFFKNETVNPTWSFKDRGSFFCVQLSVLLGEKRCATISTGNMGHSMAAYGKRAGLETLIFIPRGTPSQKILPMLLHQGRVITLKGENFSELKTKVLTLSRDCGLRTVTGNGPHRIEGYKSLSFELTEQSGGDLPDYIALPVSATGHARGVYKGFKELFHSGIISRIPRLILVQAARNAPLALPLKRGEDRVLPFSDFTTAASALITGNPPGGDAFLRLALDNRWLGETVTEEEIIRGVSLLASEGIYAEASSATVVCALKKLVKRGALDASSTVAAIITGSGLKNDPGIFSGLLLPPEMDPVELEPFLRGTSS